MKWWFLLIGVLYTYLPKIHLLLVLLYLAIMILNFFGEMVNWQEPLSLFTSWDHFWLLPPLRISKIMRKEIELVQNLCTNFVEWRYVAVKISIQRRYYGASFNFSSVSLSLDSLDIPFLWLESDPSGTLYSYLVRSCFKNEK